MSAIEELRNLLDERGVEYKSHYLNTSWHVGMKLYMATDNADGTLTVDNLTPEQAIAATLGGGECEWELEHSGTLYDKWRCSECKFLFVEPRCDQGYTDLVPNYCPNCGKAVKR